MPDLSWPEPEVRHLCGTAQARSNKEHGVETEGAFSKTPERACQPQRALMNLLTPKLHPAQVLPESLVA